MDDKINIHINLDEKLDTIRTLFNLIDNIKNDKKRFLLKYKFQTELDFAIDKLEIYYYKYVLKNKSKNKIENETEKMIYSSRKTIDAFMPYILLYNLTEQHNNTNNNTTIN
tara:strand:+ start:135 stop:467 length:333 start_codon:yes stop_codon:yes gene_type:complete